MAVPDLKLLWDRAICIQMALRGGRGRGDIWLIPVDKKAAYRIV